MLTIQSVLADLNANSAVPQPEGSEIAAAYRAGDIDGSMDTALHVFAVLLAKARIADDLLAKARGR